MAISIQGSFAAPNTERKEYIWVLFVAQQFHVEAAFYSTNFGFAFFKNLQKFVGFAFGKSEFYDSLNHAYTVSRLCVRQIEMSIRPAKATVAMMLPVPKKSISFQMYF